MGDAISAASLLMAVVAILYGAWYQEISCATRVTVPLHDRYKELAIVQPALFARCLPLACMATLVVLVFLPVMVGVIWHAVTVLHDAGLQAYSLYNPARTAFCLVVMVAGAMAAHLWRMTAKLVGLWRKLKA